MRKAASHLRRRFPRTRTELRIPPTDLCAKSCSGVQIRGVSAGSAFALFRAMRRRHPDSVCRARVGRGALASSSRSTRSAGRFPGRCRSSRPTTGGISTSRRRRSIPHPPATSRSSATAHATAASGLRRRRIAGQRGHLRLSLRRRRRRRSRRRPCSSSTASESDGVNHATGQSFPFYPIPDEAITQAHWIEGGEPGNVDRAATPTATC